jgi:hypothetical protein
MPIIFGIYKNKISVSIISIVFFLTTTIFVCFATIIFIDTLFLSVKFFQPLFFSDGWNTVAHYEIFNNGEYNISYLFSQHNEHRIALPRLIFFADFIFAKGLNKINVISTWIIQLLHIFILSSMALYPRTGCKYIAIIVISAIIILFFSMGQHENYFWGFQVQFVGVYAAATLAFWWFARSLESRKEIGISYLFGASSVVMALIATYCMSKSPT